MELPKIGKYYHFFDDGKTGPSRHYICRIERILTVNEAKELIPEDCIQSLYYLWLQQIKTYNFLFAKETDYFIEISCPNYDDNLLYAVRTKKGGWFTLDIQSFWQGGELDVTGKIYESCLDNWEYINGWIPLEEYPEANEDNYIKIRDN